MTLRRSDELLTMDGTVGGPTAVVRDLIAYRTGTNTNVYAITDKDNDGIVHLRSDASGDLRYIDNQFEEGENPLFYFRPDGLTDPSGGDVITLLSQPYLVVGGREVLFDDSEISTGSTFISIGAGGVLTINNFFDVDDTSTVSIETPEGVRTFSRNFFEIEDRGGDLDDRLFSGSLTTLGDFTRGILTLESNIADQYHVAGAINGGGFGTDDTPYFFYVKDTTFEINYVSYPFGGGVYGDTIEGSGTSKAKAPKDLEIVNVAGDAFLVTSSVKGGLKVYDVDDEGRFKPSISLKDERDSNNGEASFATDTIETFEIGNRGFIAAAGERMHVFEVGEDGSLFAMDGTSWRHGDIHDVEISIVQGKAQIFVATDDGVQTFVFTPDQAQDVRGTMQADVIRGDSRDNKIEGRGGADRLDGVGGDDELIGGGGQDELIGGRGNDRLHGGGDRDDLKGGRGNDRLFGDQSADLLIGGTGNDTLYGGGGGDELRDGTGRDVLFGGGGVDTFVMTQDNTLDTIRTWERRDKIDLTDYGRSLDFNDLRFEARPDGDVIVSIGRDQLELDAEFRISIDSIVANDFIFA